MGDDQPRKLIEVALPLPEISKASVADKNRKVGTIKNLHKWFAPMPTPALRALIFASLVNDPGNDEDREKLSEFIKELVPGNGTRTRRGRAGEGQEADRAGQPRAAYGSGAVLRRRVDGGGGAATRPAGRRLRPQPRRGADNPSAGRTAAADGTRARRVCRARRRTGQQPMIPKGTPFEGFIADLRYYGGLVQEAVQKKLGGLYPDIPQGDPVAWLWSRTVPCPNPMCGATVPLFSSPVLSKQPAARHPLRLSSRARTSGFFCTTRRTVLAGRSRFQGVVRGSSA